MLTTEELEARGAEYRACKAAIGPARRAALDAEMAHALRAMADRAKFANRGHACTPECIAPVRKAFDDLLWVKACVIAAGEAYKERSFADCVGG